MIITINAWKNYDHSYLNIFLCSSNLRSFILHIQLTNFCKSKHKVCNQDGHHYFIFHSEQWRKHSKMEKKTSCTLELRKKSILKDKIGMQIIQSKNKYHCDSLIGACCCGQRNFKSVCTQGQSFKDNMHPLYHINCEMDC